MSPPVSPVSVTRRAFLRAATAGGAALAGFSLRERSASARAFGAPPDGYESFQLAPALRVKRVLEVFYFGGLSHYESFFCVPDYGAADATQWNAFLASGQLQAAVDSCAFSGAPALLQPFGQDEGGASVSLGPFAMPLRERPDLTARMRICVTAHGIEPHEAAVPLAISGRALGHPALAGLGTHVERFKREAGKGASSAPNAWVLSPSASILGELTQAATSTGLHPSASRPIGVKIDAAGDFAKLLSRGTVGDARQRHDAVVQASIDRYRSRLTWKTTPLRAQRLDELGSAASTMSHADVLQGLLSAELLAPLAGASCGASATVDATTMSLRLAAHLLTDPTNPATYISVFDGGFLPTKDAGGYDSHSDNCMVQGRNLTSSLRALASIINAPGEGNPGKLDLDDTLIILNTEFGRSPDVQGMNGRGHWPYGYPVVYLGGPIRSPGISGAIGPDARSTSAATPSEHRVAALDALGIWPFASESFNVSDVQGVSTEHAALASIHARIFGASS